MSKMTVEEWEEYAEDQEILPEDEAQFVRYCCRCESMVPVDDYSESAGKCDDC